MKRFLQRAFSEDGPLWLRASAVAILFVPLFLVLFWLARHGKL